MGKQIHHLCSYKLSLFVQNLLVVPTDNLSHIWHTAVAYFYNASEVFNERGASWKIFVNQEQKLMFNICSNFSVIGRIEPNNFYSSHIYIYIYIQMYVFEPSVYILIFKCMYLNQDLYYLELKPTNNSALLEKYA